jgi:hypothetical protein
MTGPDVDDLASGYNVVKQPAMLLVCPAPLASCFACCRSDEDDPSGSKYSRMEEDSIQDKERFAR